MESIQWKKASAPAEHAKDQPQHTSHEAAKFPAATNDPWFGVTFGLAGFIVGYLLFLFL